MRSVDQVGEPVDDLCEHNARVDDEGDDEGEAQGEVFLYAICPHQRSTTEPRFPCDEDGEASKKRKCVEEEEHREDSAEREHESERCKCDIHEHLLCSLYTVAQRRREGKVYGAV